MSGQPQLEVSTLSSSPAGSGGPRSAPVSSTSGSRLPEPAMPSRSHTLDSPKDARTGESGRDGGDLSTHRSDRRPSADDLGAFGPGMSTTAMTTATLATSTYNPNPTPYDSRPPTPSNRSPGRSSRSDDSHARQLGGLGHSSSVVSHSAAASPSTPVAALPCSACQIAMSGQFVRALNTVYHLDCFRCKDCNCVVASKFFPIDGPDGRQHPLCERDYFRRLNLICGKCDQALRGSYITACNKKFHVEHFTCSVCPTLFGPQDSYYEHDSDVYCHYHYSTRFATKCAGCSSAILKQFVEINRNMRDECWHPECYMIHKFWNVKVVTRPTSLISTNSQETLTDKPFVTEEEVETPATLKQRQQRMEQMVYRIWTVLSAFEESSAACISEMLRHVSNGLYLDAIRSAEKFILHVEVLFATIDNLEFHFANIHVKGMSHVREARMLCRKTVDLFTLLSHTQESAGSRRMGMTQELLALVTGLAHYLKILIRIALTGALKLDREHQVQDALPSFLDKLQRLAKVNGNPGSPRVLSPEEAAAANSGVEGTKGVAFGYRSLSPELTADWPFWGTQPRSYNGAGPPKKTPPPSDLCISCKLTVEEDCVRLGTYQRWHSHCVKCSEKDCPRNASPPMRPVQRSPSDEKDKESKPSTIRRPPALVHEFLFELTSPDSRQAPNGAGSEDDSLPFVSAIYCMIHVRQGGRTGFEAVSRLEQYAFLLNVALRRLHLLLKKRGVITATSPVSPDSEVIPSDTSSAAYDAYRDSGDIMRMKSVHLDRKLSATARLPKRSTIVESPSGRIAQPTNVQHSGTAKEVPPTTRSQGNIMSAPGGGPGSASGHGAPPSGTRSPRPAPAQAPNGNARQLPTQRLQMPPPALQPENGLTSPGSNGQPPHGHIIRPPFARDNTQVYIVDDTAPQTPAEERANFAPIGEEEEGITLADLPQLMEVEQAREQRRSLPQHGGKPLISDLSPLELAVVKHAALLALARSPIKDAFDLDDILELVEVKKGGFWNKLFKGGNDKKVKKKGVFGVPLELLVEREGADSLLGASRTPLRVPSFIEDVISAMKQMDMSIEGIFRKNGNIRRLKELSDTIDRDPESVDLTQDNPVQLAALLKKFLRELPDPLMTYKLHRLLVVTQSQPNEADRKRLLHLVSLLLPKFHRDTMEVLFVFLKWVASFSHVDEETGSKMDLPNLATVLCPSILYSKSRDPARDESFSAIRVVTQLLEEQDEFWAVPDEFLALLEDQDYFSNSMELTSKDFLKKVDTYMRVKSGRGGMAGGLMNPSPIIGGSLPGGTPRPEDIRMLPQRSDPNIPRGRTAPPSDGSRPAGGRNLDKHALADSRSLERPSTSDPNGHHSPPKHPGLTRQPFSHPGPGGGSLPSSAHGHDDGGGNMPQNFTAAGNAFANHNGFHVGTPPGHMGSPRLQPVQQPPMQPNDQPWPSSPRLGPVQQPWGAPPSGPGPGPGPVPRQTPQQPGSRPGSFVRTEMTPYPTSGPTSSSGHSPPNGRQSPYQPRDRS